MRKADGSLLWCRVSGHSTDPQAPARESVWAFEPLEHAAGPSTTLSPREREVMAQLATGQTAKEIVQHSRLEPAHGGRCTAPGCYASSGCAPPLNCWRRLGKLLDTSVMNIASEMYPNC